MGVSIIIPAYNEENRIKKTLDRIITQLNMDKIDYEIIISVSKSTDKTLEIVKEYSNKYNNIKYIENTTKTGKGLNIKLGVEKATKEIIMFTDADLSVDIQALYKCIGELKNADTVIINRQQKKKQPFYRIIIGHTFRIITRSLTGLKYRDTQCGFKVFKRDVAKHLFSLSVIEGFAFDVEILMLADYFGYKVKEIEYDWYDSKESKVNIIKDSIRMFIDLIKIKHMIQRGSYGQREVIRNEIN